MLHEARDRQKFLSDAQTLRDMQHKVESEYQACLRGQESRRDSNEKKRDPFGGQETNAERAWFLNGSSSKQSSSEEDLQAQPGLSAKSSSMNYDSRLPAIDQTSVKQKHKSTMTARQPEKVGSSKPSPAAPPPQILSRKRRPNLGRMTVSPDMHSPRGAAERSRQKPQLPGKAPALWGADAFQREGPMWASDTKLKRPILERRNLVPSSQTLAMSKNTPERARKGDLRGLSQKEPRPALSQAFPGMNSPRVLSESLGPPLFTTTMGGSRRVPFRFRDEDFYSMLSLSHGEDDEDTEEEIHAEEELLLLGMHAPHSPSSHKRSQFLGTQAKFKNFKENPGNYRANSVRNEPSHGSQGISSVREPVREQSSDGQRMFQDPRLPDGESTDESDSSDDENEKKQSSDGQRMFQDPRLPDGESTDESDSSDDENEKKTFCSQDTKFKPNLDDDLNAEHVFSDSTSLEDRSGTQDCEREWQPHLHSSSTSPDSFSSGTPTAPRSPRNPSYNIPGSLMHSAPREDIPGDLSMTSTFAHSSDSEGNSRFHARPPLSPIRNRNSFASVENHSYFPGNSAHEFGVRGAEANPLTSQSQRAPVFTEDLLLNSQSSMPLMEPSGSFPPGMNLQGHLLVPGSLQENMPFTFFAVSDFPNQSGNGDRRAVFGFIDEKEATEKKADPEKLKKLQESLLEEDSEEEGDLCRICQIAGGSPTNPLLEPCGCVGSLQFVHQECLKKWLKVKITSGANLGAVKTCEMCKQGLLVDLDDFNMTEFYQKHQQSRLQNELMNSGLYLVLLLHLYEQRFAELMRLNYSRAGRERSSRNFPRPRPEENESSDVGDGNENGIYEDNSRVI